MALLPADLLLPAKFADYRRGQLDIAADIAASRARVTLLSAETGCGKSLIAMTAARLMGARRVLVLVETKGLQSQWHGDFKAAGMADVRGQANYRCRARASSCEDGDDCRQRRGGPAASCPYVVARDAARRSTVVVTNYAYWLAMRTAAPEQGLGEFDLLVCDEAHGAHDAVADALAIEVDGARVEGVTRVGIVVPSDVSDMEAWRAYANAAIGAAGNVESGVGGGGGKAWRRQARDLARLAALGDGELGGWVAERVSPNAATAATSAVYRLSPVWAYDHGYMEAALYRGVPRVLAMSATLLPDDAHYLGLQASSNDGAPTPTHDYMEADSGFDPARRPFTYLPTARVDYRMTEAGLRLLVNRLDSFMEARLALGRKGVVHAVSYDRAAAIARLSRCGARLITHDSRGTREAVDRFKRSREACVLLSPAVVEGYDFPDDACRWQVLVKVPFVDGRGAVMRARLGSDRGYRDHLAARDIVQMAGRGMRSAADWCETVVMDEHWGWFSRRASWPGWFKRSWRVDRQVPPPMEAPAQIGK